MKTEQEIRDHRDDLRAAMRQPCECAGTEHEESCYRGMKMMKAVERTLSWALGENPELDRLVQEMREDVRG